MGPGDLKVAHSVHEKVGKDELEKAIQVYRDMALEICLGK